MRQLLLKAVLALWIATSFGGPIHALPPPPGAGEDDDDRINAPAFQYMFAVLTLILFMAIVVTPGRKR